LWAEEIANATLKELTALYPVLGISPLQSAKFVDNYKKQGLKERVKFHTQNFQKECGEKFRMLCFSENAQSPLMWGHYCNCHEGFALKFDTNHPFFHERLAKVHYDKERPKINSSFPGLSIPLTKN
jgi:predicted adenine nucleotide alpha hydrolase (AANH) superfamily ATPase